MELSRIKEIVAEQLSVEISELREETSLKEDLNADSLDLFQIVMALEEEAEMEIPTEDTEKIRTLGDIVAYIEAHKQ